MYYVYVTSGPSLLIESTDSMVVIAAVAPHSSCYCFPYRELCMFLMRYQLAIPATSVSRWPKELHCKVCEVLITSKITLFHGPAEFNIDKILHVCMCCNQEVPYVLMWVPSTTFSNYGDRIYCRDFSIAPACRHEMVKGSLPWQLHLVRKFSSQRFD